MTKTTQYKNIPIGTIPNDWEVKKLGEVGEISSGGTPSTTVEEYWNGDINWCTPTDISALSSEYLDDTTAKITEAGLKNSSAKILPPNSIIVCTRATIGKAAINSQPMSTNQGFKNIIPVGINHKFLYYKILAEENGLKRIANGSTFLEVSKSDFENYHISLPPLPEQHKIAEVLSTWDKAIQQTDAIIKKLEDRNKALANKLFEENNWQINKLSDLFERVTDKNKEGNTTVTTISAKHGFILQEDFFNKTVASKDLSNYYLINKGDFCYNKSYSKDYDWGVVKRLNDFEKAVVTTLYICFRFKDNSQNSDFWELYFENKILDKALSKVAQEGGRAHGLLNVTSGDFFGIKVKVPSLEEQNAIAEILNTANQEVKQYQQKLEALKLQKKGLMQQLLTGKVRTV